jgi:hypothetical protein
MLGLKLEWHFNFAQRFPLGSRIRHRSAPIAHGARHAYFTFPNAWLLPHLKVST